MMYQILISILVGIVIGCILFYIFTRSGRKKYVFPSQGARFSEEEVEGILKRAGYQILGKQQKKTIITKVDGKDHFGYLEADYTVRKGKKTYVVVVKTGEGAADPNEPLLRRKLLEQDYVFSPDGVLLLDLGQGELHDVNFRFPQERNIDVFFRFLIALFIILLVIGIIWVLAVLRLI